MSSPTAEPIAAASDPARRARLYAAWQKHSDQIHLYRRLLPGAIVLVVVVLLGWTLFNTVAWRFIKDADQQVSIRMVNPKFYGRTGDNSPYLVGAASATRDEQDFQRVVLDQPLFIQNLDLPTQTELRARTGVYREDTRVLRLENDLVLIDKRGYQFRGQDALIDTRAGTVRGDRPISGRGPLGQIAASSYAITDGGDRIIFRGKVRSRILQSQDR
jgi:lipopolysaccharide export system protein LptC